MLENKALPSFHYQQAVLAGELTADPVQQQILPLLDQLHVDLTAKAAAQQQLLTRIKESWFPSPPVDGLYLWGGVGRGKTYLLDVFFDGLPFANKKRLHFYRFMHWVHQELAQAQELQQKNPLSVIARKFRQQALVLCFDEFFVDDVADAMILTELMQSLFAAGITLVTTSNIAPDDLYRNGVHRDRFLPAIDLIKRHTIVQHLDGSCDYRLRYLAQASLYFMSSDDASSQQLCKILQHLDPDHWRLGGSVTINDRVLPVRGLANNVLWCDFKVLCQEARGQYDYIEIAKIYHTVIISDLIKFGEADANAAKRFISLVDELYDHNVKLIMSAEVGIHELYQSGPLAFAFARTKSRLLEMQSTTYLARSHNP